MRKLQFVCDGCDLVDYADKLPSNMDFMLEGWVAHHLSLRENDSPTNEIMADLCPSCSEKLRNAMDPRNWPRVDATVRKFEKSW